MFDHVVLNFNSLELVSAFIVQYRLDYSKLMVSVLCGLLVTPASSSFPLPSSSSSQNGNNGCDDSGGVDVYL